MTDKKQAGAKNRIHLLEQMASLHSSEWLGSGNPIKQRIARVEVAWREGLQWLMEDVKKMYDNLLTLSDGIDTVDVNLAAVKSLCVDKKLFTEEEFKARQTLIFGMLDRSRERKQQELDALLAAEKEKVDGKLPETVADDNVVDPRLVKMRERAAATTDDDHFPKHATQFGG